jgi:hypothetical protein
MKERCATTDYRRIRRWKHEAVLESDATAARSPARDDESAARNSRASVRNDQALDGLDALPDEDVGARAHARDGALFFFAWLKSEAVVTSPITSFVAFTDCSNCSSGIAASCRITPF